MSVRLPFRELCVLDLSCELFDGGESASDVAHRESADDIMRLVVEVLIYSSQNLAGPKKIKLIKLMVKGQRLPLRLVLSKFILII
jgi:hypothetical protein